MRGEAEEVEDGASIEEVRVLSDGKLTVDAASWMTTVIPFLEKSGVLPPVREPRVEQYLFASSDFQSSSVLIPSL